MTERDHDALIRALASGLAPVRRLASPWAQTLLWLGVCCGGAAGLVAAGGLDGLWCKLAAGPAEVLEMIGATLTAGLAAAAAFQLATPGRSKHYLLLPLPSFLLWVVASLCGCWETQSIGESGLHPPQACFRFIVATSVPLSLIFFLMLRRAYPVRPALTASMAGLAAAAAAAALLDFVHPFGVTAPDLVAHAAAIVIVIGGNSLATGRALRRWALVAAAALLSTHAAHAQSGRPVVADLFTARDCLSCPPADALLAELARSRPDLLPLAFHAEYWNRLGWTDPYSAAAFTARKRLHAAQLGASALYTPEMVVDGARAVIGSDQDEVDGAIRAAKGRVFSHQA